MLAAILSVVRTSGRPMCLADLSRELGIDEPALEGMLETLVARGRLRTIQFEDDGCSVCSVKSGCFLMSNGVARTYALPLADAPPERAAVRATAP